MQSQRSRTGPAEQLGHARREGVPDAGAQQRAERDVGALGGQVVGQAVAGREPRPAGTSVCAGVVQYWHVPTVYEPTKPRAISSPRAATPAAVTTVGFSEPISA